MKNGIYNRTELNIVIYQRGDGPEDTFVVVSSDLQPGEPMVVAGKKAHDFAIGLINQIGDFEGEESE